MEYLRLGLIICHRGEGSIYQQVGSVPVTLIYLPPFPRCRVVQKDSETVFCSEFFFFFSIKSVEVLPPGFETQLPGQLSHFLKVSD